MILELARREMKLLQTLADVGNSARENLKRAARDIAKALEAPGDGMAGSFASSSMQKAATTLAVLDSVVGMAVPQLANTREEANRLATAARSGELYDLLWSEATRVHDPNTEGARYTVDLDYKKEGATTA